MKRIVLDTDVSSLSIKDKLPPAERTSLGIAQFSITFVTLGELTQWATFRDWGPRNRARLERWLASKAILPYSEDVARKWGELSGFALRRGRPRPANDTWIAACCLVYSTRCHWRHLTSRISQTSLSTTDSSSSRRDHEDDEGHRRHQRASTLGYRSSARCDRDSPSIELE